MNVENNAGYSDFINTVTKWKEIFIQGINHPHELGETNPSLLTWEEIIFKGRLDAIDICLLADEALTKVGSFNERAKYFIYSLPYFGEVTELISTLQFRGDYGGADLPNGDKVAFLPRELESGGLVIRSYIKLKQPFKLDGDILVLMEQVFTIVRFVEDFPPEYYEKRKNYEERCGSIPPADDNLPF